MRAERGSTIERCVDDQHVDCSRHEQTAYTIIPQRVTGTQSASSRTAPSEDEIVLPGWSC